MKVGHNEARSSDKQPTGKVVGIIKRNWRAYACNIDSTSLTSSNHSSLSLQTVFASPVSRLLPRIRLCTRQAPSLLNQKILVTIDRWDPTSRYPEGHFVRALGRVESKEAVCCWNLKFLIGPLARQSWIACLKKGILGPFRPRPRAR